MSSAEVVVVGHICLDVILRWPPESELEVTPGTIKSVGPADISTGGCVPNTGIALGKLGVNTLLLGRIGDDEIGNLIKELLGRLSECSTCNLLIAAGEYSSYSVILSPPGIDRVVLHYPGTNDTFSSRDVPMEALVDASILHFGYPPIMRMMYSDGGAELEQLLKKAKMAGVTTSLDMAYPDPNSPAGRANWQEILTRILPWVDVFAPSIVEVLAMLGHNTQKVDAELVVNIGNRLLAMGPAVVALKLGENGLYLRTGSIDRLMTAGRGIPDAKVWAERELWCNAFQAEVVGTTGAGDATVAGLLTALLRGIGPKEAIAIACAVGASSVESQDATSGIPSWDTLRARMDSGWARRLQQPGPDWSQAHPPGIWVGPRDKDR